MDGKLLQRDIKGRGILAKSIKLEGGEKDFH